MDPRGDIMRKVVLILISFFILYGCSVEKAGQIEKDANTVSTDQSSKEESTLNEASTDEESVEVHDDIEMSVKEYTSEEKQMMTEEFFNWAVDRAKIGNLAVTIFYFQHGAAGRGDWYALTPDGQVQVQNLDNPGFESFDIHAIGGVVFYTPLSGDYGRDETAPTPGIAEGYNRLAVENTNIHKYMLADNGVVYELIGKKENVGSSTGFGEYDDDGTVESLNPTVQFIVSKDQDAQNEWRRILNKY